MMRENRVSSVASNSGNSVKSVIFDFQVLGAGVSINLCVATFKMINIKLKLQFIIIKTLTMKVFM